MSNRILTEGEVARLYARRRSWELESDELLEQAVAGAPFPLDTEGSITAFMQPVVPCGRLATGTTSVAEHALVALTRAAGAADPYPDQGDLAINGLYQQRRHGPRVWSVSADRRRDSPRNARLDLHRDGSLRYWAKPLVHAPHGVPLFLERSATRHTAQFIAAASELAGRLQLSGPVHIGVAIDGLADASGASMVSGFGEPYGEPDYLATERIDAAELADTQTLAIVLLAPLFDVTSISGYQPFDDRG